MAEHQVQIKVRSPAEGVRVLDVQGVLGGAAREPMLGACDGAQALVLNMSGLEAIEPLGVSLLIELQARVREQKQPLLAYGLKPWLEKVFSLTQLDEALRVYTDEAQALTGA